MNANRTKYASTPTYGMQKRGFMKKAPVRQAPETPDFSQVPQPAPTMPPASPQTQQAFAQSVPPQGGFSGMPPYFSAPMQGTAQVPFASPSFIQPMAGQPPFQGFAPGSTASVPPLGNTAFGSSSAAFSPRSQGFVPPSRGPPSLLPPPLRPCGRGNPNPFGPRYSPLCTPFLPCSPARPERRRRPCPATPLRGE